MNRRVSKTVLVVEGNKDFSWADCAVVLRCLWRVSVMDADGTQPSTARVGDADEQQSDRGSDGGVDTVLETREDGYKDGSEPDEELQGANEPELVQDSRRGNEVTNLDADSGKKKCQYFQFVNLREPLAIRAYSQHG